MAVRSPDPNLAQIERLIVDGYNLLHAAGLSRARYAPRDLQRQRHKLLARLSGLLNDRERRHCTVAFDAFDAPPGLPRRSSHGEITVLFAEPGADADGLIETLIEADADPSHLLVVSGDNRIQHAARRARAVSISSEDFLTLVQRRQDAIRPQHESGVPPAPAPGSSSERSDDIAYWERQFGVVDVKELEPADDAPAGDTRTRELLDFQRMLDDDTHREDWLNRPPRKPSR